MKNSKRPDSSSWMRTLTLIAVSAVAVAGCSGETPTAPGGFEPSPTQGSMLVDDTHGAIDGVVFADANQNGVRDPDEVGLSGVTVDLGYPTGATATAVTDAEGHYFFDALSPAFYVVTAPVVPNWMQTTPANVTVRVVAAAISTVDHGLYSAQTEPDTGSLSGTVFDDVNENGIQDAGEAGLGGLDVELVDSEAMASSATTDAEGHYAFADVTVGSYTVNGPTVEGWTATTATSVSSEVLADATTNVDFGLTMEESGEDVFATIGGVVFEDLDGDGMRGPDEPGIGGVLVRLSSRNTPRNADTRRGFGIHQYAMTDADGAYAFEDVSPGTWRVFATTRRGRHATSDSSLDFTVLAGDEVDDADFGMSRH